MSILQNKRFRVGAGIAAVVLAVAAIGAGTYAAFVDTETGPSGTVAAGTLDLTVGSTGTLELINVSTSRPASPRTPPSPCATSAPSPAA